MNTLIHADVFFFITSVWVIVISAVVAIILIYIAVILNDLRHISRRLREGSEGLADDLNDWRTSVHKDGIQIQGIISYFKHIFSKRKNHKK